MNAQDFLNAEKDCDRCPLTGHTVAWKGRQWRLDALFVSAFHAVKYGEHLILQGGIRPVVMEGMVFIRQDGGLMAERDGHVVFVALPGLNEAMEDAMEAAESAIVNRNSAME